MLFIRSGVLRLPLTFSRLAFVADFGKQNFHLKTNFDMENKTSTNHENGNDANRLLADSYYWHCRFTFPNDKLECYLTERNNCKTFKELRRWWRKEKPALKLVSAVRQ